MFQIKLAGVVAEIDSRSEYLRWLCRDYLVVGETADFIVRAGARELQEEWNENPPSLRRANRNYLEGNCVYRQICLNMIDYGGFLMHSAVVEVGGGAIAFAARSGVGKTIHVRLWLERYSGEVRVLNGDKPIFRFLDGTLYACGTPWNGKEDLGYNGSAPLKALCFLERGGENRIERLPVSDALPRLFQQVLLPREPARMERFLQLLDRMLAATPCWLLHCDMTPAAAETARRGILGGD